MATATNAQKIAGLYAAFFNRAPDAAGLSYWETQFTGTATVNTIASLFAAHPVFETTYGAMTDVEFVNSIYLNVLGAAGDANGVDYWVGQLKNGGADARANFVAKFVNDALTVDLSTFTNLTAAELAVAQGRQDTLTNKVNAGLYFAEKFGAASNITTTGDITKDPAYLAAQAAIKNVTADKASVTDAQARIDVAVGTSDPASSLIGQNSALTAKLVALAAANKAQADFLGEVEAFQTTNKLASVDGKIATLNAEVQASLDAAAAKGANVSLNVAAGVLADNKAAVVKDQAAITAAQAKVDAVTDLNKALIAQKAVIDASAAVAKATTADGVAQAAVNSAADTFSLGATYDKAALKPAAGANPVTLVEDAGNAVITLDSNGKLAVTDLYKNVDGVDAVLAAVTTAQASQAALASAKAVEIGVKAAYTTELQNVVKADADGADTAGTLNAAKAQLVNDQKLVDTLQKAIDLSKSVAVLDAKNDSLIAAHDKAVADVKALDVNLVDDAATQVGTAADDLFVVAGHDAVINNFALNGADKLFIGTNYAAGTGDFLKHEGNANALEVFFVQNGADTKVVIENKAFASNATNPTDITTITLTGVKVADVHFENGFVSHVA